MSNYTGPAPFALDTDIISSAMPTQLSSKVQCQVSLGQLEQIAVQIALQLLPGDILLLYGELGSGKTTFTQFLARALQVPDDEYVASPSFALLHEYHGSLPIYHMDLYRLNSEEQIEESGLLEYFSLDGVTVVEWPERLGNLVPEEYLALCFKEESGSRVLQLTGQGAEWNNRLPELCQSLSSF